MSQELSLSIDADPAQCPRTVDLRGTPCADFLAECEEVISLVRSGSGVWLRLSRGQALYLALGVYGVDPVLGPYTITPDLTGCDYELRCSASPDVIDAYSPDWSQFWRLQPRPAPELHNLPTPTEE